MSIVEASREAPLRCLSSRRELKAIMKAARMAAFVVSGSEVGIVHTYPCPTRRAD
jgi:hypothetical protein